MSPSRPRKGRWAPRWEGVWALDFFPAQCRPRGPRGRGSPRAQNPCSSGAAPYVRQRSQRKPRLDRTRTPHGCKPARADRAEIGSRPAEACRRARVRTEMASIVPPKIRLLVVDDEPGLRTMLEILLGREGYAVVTAPSYAVA